MNAALFRHIITVAATDAMENEPDDLTARLRCFVATLSGRLHHEERAAADAVWALLAIPRADDPVTPPQAPQ